jgi:glycosyltransferase involved in cell wall biosynthesis
VTSGHDVADARLHRVVAACLRAGLSIEVFALGESSAAPDGAVVHTRGRGSVVRRAGTAIDFARRSRGRVLLAMDPDSTLACLAIGRLRRRIVVADVHEDYLSLLRDRKWASGPAGPPAAVVARFATWAAARADLTVVADEHVPPTWARDRMIVRNLPDPAMLPDPTSRDETPRALYVGDVRTSRGLWQMLDVLEQAAEWHLDVVGPVAAADQDETQRRLRGSGLAERVRFHGRMPPEQAWTLARGAWCGLVMLQDTPAFREAMPSKLFEYLACGLGVIVTDLPRQRELVERIGAGRVVDNGPDAVSQAADQLRRWVQCPSELDVCRANAATWAAGHATSPDYNALAARLVKLASARG